MRKFLATALLLSVAAGVLVLLTTLLTKRDGPNPVGTSTRPQDAEDRTGSAPPLVDATSGVEPGVEFVAPERPGAARTQAPAASALASRVLCSEGHPAAGSVVSWTPLRPEFLGTWVGSSSQDWPAIEAASLVSVADGDGAFRFPEPLGASDSLPTVLWVTHERHLPGMVLLAAHAGFPPVIELGHAEPMQVFVSTPDGNPVDGALVEQMTPVPQSALADAFTPQARRILRRVVSSGSDGLAALAAWDGPLLLSASLGEVASEVWIGEPRERIELVLHPTFEVSGSVRHAAGAEIEIEGQQRVVCSVVKGTQLQELALVPVLDGTFGPVALPVLDADGYGFRLEGWNVEIRDERIEPPAAGELVRVDFEARAGLDLWTLIVDGDEQPIPDSEATIAWEQDGLRVEARGHPRDDGYTLVRGVPAGAVSFTGRAPGYAQSGFGPFVVPLDPPATITLTMEPGWKIEGAVLHAGRPVEDFELAWWSLDTATHTTAPFRERQDGRFSILAEPGRMTHLVASAVGLGPSEVITVHPGETAAITLELPSPVRGTGIVVDAVTGNPLPQANLQTFVAGPSGAVSPFGPPRDVRADGRFDRTIFAVGRGMTRFSAQGYATHWAETLGRPGETIEFGSIALTGRRDLTVRITSDEPFDPTEYWLVASGVESIPRKTFGADGEVVIEQLSPGRYCLQVRGATLLDSWVYLEPQAEWRIELPVGGERALRVEVDLGELPLEGLQVRAHVPGRKGGIIQLFAEVPPERTVEFRGVLPGEYGLFLTAPSGLDVGATHGRLAEDETLVVARLAPFGTARTLFVVDQAGSPVPGGSVTLVQPDNRSNSKCELDQAGRGELQGLEPGQYLARILHPALGTHHNLPLTVSARSEEPLRLVFAPDHSVALELRDGTEALPGVRCQLWEEHERFSVSVVTSDASGRARWDHLGPGSYRAWISHPDVWPIRPLVAARPAGETAEVQVRRLGGLELTARGADGSPLSGRLLELTSEEFASPVSDWLSEQRVASSTGGMRTDAQGVLELSGLPRGTYSWSLNGAGGLLEVHPGVTAEIVLLAP